MSTNRTADAPPGRAALVRSALAAAAAAFAAAALLAASPAPAAAGPAGALTVKLTAHPPEFTKDHTATFNWATVGILGETRCKIDSGPYTYCQGRPARYFLPDGRHAFTVRVRNGYKVVAKASWTWTVDTAAPTPPNVTGGSLSWRTGTGVTVAGAAAPTPRAASADTSTGRQPTAAPGRTRLPGPPCWSSPRDRRWWSSAPRIAPATSPPGRPAPPLPATPSASTARRPPCRRLPAAR